MLRSNAAPEANLETHLTDILQHLSGRELVLRQLRENGLRTDLFVGIFGIADNCGFSLSPEIARPLGELGLTIGFDLYPAGEQEIEDATRGQHIEEITQEVLERRRDAYQQLSQDQ